MKLLTPLTDETFTTTASHLCSKQLTDILTNVSMILDHNEGLLPTSKEEKKFCNMWKNYEGFLCLYAHCLYVKLSSKEKNLSEDFKKFTTKHYQYQFIIPEWWINERIKNKIMSSHKAHMENSNIPFFIPPFSKPLR